MAYHVVALTMAQIEEARANAKMPGILANSGHRGLSIRQR